MSSTVPSPSPSAAFSPPHPSSPPADNSKPRNRSQTGLDTFLTKPSSAPTATSTSTHHHQHINTSTNTTPSTPTQHQHNTNTNTALPTTSPIKPPHGVQQPPKPLPDRPRHLFEALLSRRQVLRPVQNPLTKSLNQFSLGVT